MSPKTIHKYGDIMIGVQARDRLSLGEDRKRLGFSAFHWSIMIRSKSEHHRFDVTDGIVQDPVTFENLNPNQDWVYRHLTVQTTSDIPRYLGAVVIGQLKTSKDVHFLAALLQKVVLPEKGKRPDQNCVSWAVDAAQMLQSNGYCKDFDIGPCKEFVLQHADERIVHFASTPDVIQYPAAIFADDGFWSLLKAKFRSTS